MAPDWRQSVVRRPTGPQGRPNPTRFLDIPSRRGEGWLSLGGVLAAAAVANTDRPTRYAAIARYRRDVRQRLTRRQRRLGSSNLQPPPVSACSAPDVGLPAPLKFLRRNCYESQSAICLPSVDHEALATPTCPFRLEALPRIGVESSARSQCPLSDQRALTGRLDEAKSDEHIHSESP